jgi:hypothetical protein
VKDLSDVKDDVIAKVDVFIDRLFNGIIEISHNAEIGEYGRRERIAGMIHEYQTCTPEQKRQAATKLLKEINELYADGDINKGDAFMQNYSWYEREYNNLKQAYESLKEKHQKLADDYIFIQGKNKQLEELLERIVPKGRDIEQ